MKATYKRMTETHVERTTHEETLMGSSRVRCQVNERGDIHEIVQVENDWESDDLGVRQSPVHRPSIHSGSRKQLGSGWL